jgi:arsenate reductase
MTTSTASGGAALSAAANPDYLIYHNNRCGNSRGALALLREHGIEPTVVDYLAHPLSAQQVQALVTRMGVTVASVIREKEAVFAQLQLGAADVTDAQRLAAIAAHPILLNRPIVVTPRGAALCRPPEKVLALLA